MTKAERNARIGRLYYNALTDAAGYPNGMAYWEELPAAEKYYHSATALQLIEMAAKEGLISLTEEIGLNDKWGVGDCKDLMEHFQATEAKEKNNLEKRIDAIRAAIFSSDKG